MHATYKMLRFVDIFSFFFPFYRRPQYDDMMAAIKNKFDAQPVLQCMGENDLHYVEVCISKSFEAIDCPRSLEDTCDSSYDVWLPAKTESRRHLRSASKPE